MSGCRDCADNFGTCPHDGKPCAPVQKPNTVTISREVYDQVCEKLKGYGFDKTAIKQFLEAGRE
jgi:hypothetical protein